MPNITEILSLLPSRRTTFWSVACVPLLVMGWFQVTDRDSPGESGQTSQSRHVAGELSHSVVAAGHNETEASSSGQIVLASATAPADSTKNAVNATDDPESRYLAAIAGEWEDEYQGIRHLKVAGDGTGKMIVDLDGIGKKLFAPRLSFDIEWSLADGYVTLKTLGGEPKSKVQLVLKLYGNEASYKILELTSDRMLLLDGDGKTQYDWRRPNASGTSANEPH